MSGKMIRQLLHWGPVYWNVPFYRITMRLLRSGGSRDMYQAVSKAIGYRSTLDLCCGDGQLKKWIDGSSYIGIEKNPVFVKYLTRKKISVLGGDVWDVPWPTAQCAVMINSLYHFLPVIEDFMKKLKQEPFERIVLSEPVQNLSMSSWKGMALFSRWATRVDGQKFPGRFTEPSLRSLFNNHGFKEIQKVGNNLIGVWNKND